MEIWKEMVADNRYEVSNFGNVRRKSNGRVRTPSSTPKGYKVIVISRPGSKHIGVYVHREVLRAFVGKCPEGYQVSHLNGNNADNRLENLAYESPTENNNRKKLHGTQTFGESHGTAKLKNEDVKRLREMLLDMKSYAEIGRILSISPSQVKRIATGKNWVDRAYNAD